MKRAVLSLWLCLPTMFINHYPPVASGVYDWRQPVAHTNKNINSSLLFEGSAFEMEWLQMTGNSLEPLSKTTNLTIPKNEERLYIIRKGSVDIMLGDSSYSLSAGSVLVMTPGKRFSIQNKGVGLCEFYIMTYRSNPPFDKEKAEEAGGSIIKNWKDVEFRPNDRGGVRTFFERPTTMLKRLEVHVTTLNPGLKSHPPHTHTAKEIIVMMEGNTEMQIDDRPFRGKEGSVYFLESNILHGITNTGTRPCTYFAIQFE